MKFFYNLFRRSKSVETPKEVPKSQGFFNEEGMKNLMKSLEKHHDFKGWDLTKY